MTFWIALMVLAAVAVALVMLPLRGARGGYGDDAAERDQVRRFSELEADVAAGEVDPAVAPALRSELERAVVDALPPAPTPVPVAARRERVVLAVICVLVPVLAFALYVELGSPQVALFSAAHPERDLRQPDVALDFLLQRLRDRVAAVPDDSAAWEILARTELQRGRYAAALGAAENLYRLAPGDTSAMLLLIDALVMSGAPAAEARARQLLESVLQLEPDNATALVLQGMFHERGGDSAAAVSSWRRALAQIPPAAPLHAQLQAMIEQATAGSSAAAGLSAPRIRLRANVSLAAALRDRAAPGDTLFVVARAVDGPAMPLAVARHTVAELPLAVTLDDTMAMVSGASLADVKSVYLIARVSRQGSALAAPGDLQGRSPAITVSDGAAANIVIDEVVQ